MKRVLTSAILIPVVLYIVLGGPPWLFLGMTALAAALCFREYSNIAAACGAPGFGPVGYVAGLAVVLADRELLLLVVLLALTAMVVAMRSSELSQALLRSGALILGVLYIFGAWKFAILLRAQSPYWLLYALVLNWIGDIAAYYVGRSWGRHKMAPRVSPGKTWEGAAASVIASISFGAFFLARFMPPIPMWQALGLSLAVNVAGQLGDLAESAVKRGARMKDSGTLLPGHGGLLDRVDSTLFALPVVYLFLMLMSDGRA